MTPDVQTIHVVFKTHLDLGFTALARQVVTQYFEQFIPSAMHLARQLRETGGQPRFVWTTGSWLIYEYLEQAAAPQRALMETAILAGDIVWHALPFTLHCELLDADLFRAGLSLSQQLDKRFGKQTTAAKMTDVPGHTRAIVPLLAEAGVRFLHIGVNEASPVPNVPSAFVWRDVDTATELMVLYDQSYGGITTLAGCAGALALSMTNENAGLPTQQDVADSFARLQSRFPQAQVTASTLDAFAYHLEHIRASLPIITDEIGDTWIHGIGSDPQKVRGFKNLLRLRRDEMASGRAYAADPSWSRFDRALFCLAEHTWGLDTKTHLNDFANYAKSDFLWARTQPPFLAMEASWQEQRDYLQAAVGALQATAAYKLAQDAVREIPPEPFTAASTDVRVFETPHFTIGIDAQTGAVVQLRARNDGYEWAHSDAPLALVQYQTFSQADYDRYWRDYNRNQERADVRAWGLLDFTKPGIVGLSETQTVAPQLLHLGHQVTEAATVIEMVLAFAPMLTEKYGAPPQVRLRLLIEDTQPRLQFVLDWQNKPINRLPEALWLSFCPLQTPQGRWQLRKMGRWIDPLHVVSKGNRTLHAVDEQIHYGDGQHELLLETFHAPLVAPGQPSLLHFEDQLPDMSGGMHINLYNNLWGTNFPLWMGGNASFAFRLSF